MTVHFVSQLPTFTTSPKLVACQPLKITIHYFLGGRGCMADPISTIYAHETSVHIGLDIDATLTGL